MLRPAKREQHRETISTEEVSFMVWRGLTTGYARSMDEQRAGERIEVGGPATLHDNGTNWSGYIKNVSHRGVFFACDQVVPAIGREVVLTCEGQPGVLARIAWIGESGCGLVILRPFDA